MLIDNQESATQPRANPRRFPSPVTGSINDNIPTSGDVHLYSDPATYFSATPMLYADCEGLDGGENIPRGAKFKHRDNSVPPASRSSSSNNDPTFRKKIRKLLTVLSEILFGQRHRRRENESMLSHNFTRVFFIHSQMLWCLSCGTPSKSYLI
jgi:hypothetical protein